MYLSKIILKWPACRNPYQWHRSIWHLFPNRPDSKRNFQFACIDRRQGCDISALVLSLEKPDRIVFSEIFLVDDPKPLSNLSFRSGQKLSFRLTANPTKIVTEQTVEKRKVRVPLIKLDQREDWLKRHLEGCVIIESVVSQNETPLYFSRGNKGGKVVPVLFQGILTVLKPDGFMEQIYKKFDKDGSYIAGLGPAKSFGCGLMLIKPV